MDLEMNFLQRIQDVLVHYQMDRYISISVYHFVLLPSNINTVLKVEKVSAPTQASLIAPIRGNNPPLPSPLPSSFLLPERKLNLVNFSFKV